MSPFALSSCHRALVSSSRTAALISGVHSAGHKLASLNSKPEGRLAKRTDNKETLAALANRCA
jgi:hypothetical protein